jgi:hypothetical protein
MLGILNKINFYDAGGALLSDIADTKKVVFIWPYTIFGASDRPNAQTIPISKAGQAGSEDAAREATAAGMLIFDADGSPHNPDGTATNDDGELRASSGYGVGTNAQVLFSPGIFESSGQITGPGSLPDEALFHELVHALRMMRGVQTVLPVNQNYHDEEEYLAIVLSNVYLSEKRQTVFRGAERIFINDDNKYNTIPLRQPENFLDNAQGVTMSPMVLIERMRLSMPKLYCAFANITPDSAAFNPVREFEKRRKAGKVSFK